MSTVWLVGMMGSGKTTVAPLVAARLGRPWHDTDEEIAAVAGIGVAELVANDLARFRQLERVQVTRLAGSDSVVACGGGVVLDAANVALMRSTGVVVFLDVPLSSLEQRVSSGDGRPLLADDPSSSLASIAASRGELYEGAAHVVIDAESPAEIVADRVVEAWTSLS